MLVLAVGALAGCGDVVKQNPDAAVDADAGLDAATDGLLRVRVLSFDGDGAPDVTAQVLVQQLDGAVIALGPVEADGSFTTTVPVAGVTVTAVRMAGVPGQTTEARLSTVIGAEPGDSIVFGLQAGTYSTSGPPATMTFEHTPVPG